MIGDNPFVIVFIVVAIVAYFAMKLGRERDPRRCPQCRGFMLGLGGTNAGNDADATFVECQKCATELVRDPAGHLHRRAAWLARNTKPIP